MRLSLRRLGLLAACFTPLIITPAGEAVILYSSDVRNTSAPAGSIAEGPWSLTGSWGSFMGTPIGPNYFITAHHTAGHSGAQFLFRGGTYTIDTSFGASGQQIPGSDLLIWRTNETFPTFVPLYGTSAPAAE